jgi:hypothetical protein
VRELRVAFVRDDLELRDGIGARLEDDLPPGPRIESDGFVVSTTTRVSSVASASRAGSCFGTS